MSDSRLKAMRDGLLCGACYEDGEETCDCWQAVTEEPVPCMGCGGADDRDGECQR